MWIAKLSSNNKIGFLREFAIKYKVTMVGYPVSSHQNEKFTQTIIVGILFGEEKNKKNLIKDMGKRKEIISIEGKEDLLITVIKEPKEAISLYSPYVIYIRPIILYPDGRYSLEIAGWDKKKVSKYIETLEKKRGFEILKFSQEKIGNISLLGFLPELTDKQKSSLKTAIINGYYDYPRRIELKNLAEKMGISLSTFRQHIRVAEKKVMGNLLKNI